MSVIYQLSDNIVSALGFTSAENFQSVANGLTGLKHYPGNTLHLPEDFIASRIDYDLLQGKFSALTSGKEYSRFEKIAIISVQKCAENSVVDLSSSATLFVVSTTKGNVSLLENKKLPTYVHEQTLLSYSAGMISRFFRNPNRPLVVSNACISGVSAQIVAARMLRSGQYKHVVVVGAEELSRFVVSGFQSFKALSNEYCKPFDINRKGLNIGEGAATVIYGIARDESELPENTIIFANGYISNDANHISGPSRTGEGLYLALEKVLSGQDRGSIGFVNTHGTATPYNDEMEAIALTRSGLNDRPANSLKGYFGHTLGAAGVLETVFFGSLLEK